MWKKPRFRSLVGNVNEKYVVSGMEVSKKVVVNSNIIRHELYGYRVDRVKYNLQIKVDIPSIYWGIHNLIIIVIRSEAAFPTAVLLDKISCAPCGKYRRRNSLRRCSKLHTLLKSPLSFICYILFIHYMCSIYYSFLEILWILTQHML